MINAVSVRNLKKSFSSKDAEPTPVLSDVSFTIGAGEVVGLFGPSGCGKSTILKILSGVIAADAGEVLAFGERLPGKRGIAAYVPQGAALFPWKTLLDNALLGWRTMNRKAPNRQTVAQANELFERFGLSSVASKYPQQSSGGERQRAALVRALLTPTLLLVLDQPVAAIDHITRTRINETLLAIVQDKAATSRPLTVMIVSHDPEELLLLCDRVLVMSQRPATIIEALPVPFNRPRSGDIRFTPEFVALKRRLWELLT